MTTAFRLLCVLALLMAGQARADTTWVLSANATDVNGWRATDTGNIYGVAETYYDCGFGCSEAGIRASDSGVLEDTDGNHGVDNDGPNELLLLRFSAPVILTTFNAQYAKEGSSYNGYADMTVLALTDSGKSGVPNGMGAPSAGLGWDDLTANGWTLVGHYSNVSTSEYRATNTSVSSSYWLVGAYNPLVGALLAGSGKCTKADGKTVEVCAEENDYVKLYAVTWKVKDDIPPRVPEPGTLYLLGLALIGLASVSKRRAT